MRNKPMSGNIVQKIIGLVFSIIGLSILAGGFVLYGAQARQLDQYTEIKAQIVYIEEYRDFDGDISHNVRVRYEFEGEEYTGVLTYYASSMREGDIVNVYIDPDNPHNYYSPEGAWMILVVFSILGGTFFLIGAGFLIFLISRRLRKKKLLRDGDRVYAQIDNVFTNRNVQTNGRHPVRIDCSWRDPADGVTYHFRSDNLWKDPTPILERQNITQLPVYLNPDKKKEYVVSLEPLEDAENHVYL